MRRRGLQLSRPHRRTLYAFSIVLLLSGAAWAWIHQFYNDGQPDGALRQLSPSLLKVHGYAALGFVLMLGTLLTGHVRRSWHARKNRTNGAFFLTVVSLLTLSGYTLYYLGDETSRRVTSQFHLWLGLAAPVLLFWHIRTGRRQTGSSQPSEQL
jgi:hypothetical protein